MTEAREGGALIWDRVATPFGVEVQATGSLTQNVRFPGQYKDDETDLLQNWNRGYDPLLGRYVQSDPIGLMGGVNTYAYVGGNPVSGYDPYGRERIVVTRRGKNRSNGSFNIVRGGKIYTPARP